MKTIAIAFFLIGIIFTNLAQVPNYRLFTMREGLSQMKITDLHIDSRGYLWIGTRNGLNKFDGEKFTVFTELDGLPHNRIHSIKEDKNGNLVILTYNGLSIFNGTSFTNYPKPFTSVLFDLAVDKDNVIWICERYTNPALYTFKNGKYQNILEKNGSLHFQYDAEKDVKSVVSQGKIYIIKNDALVLLDTSAYFFYPNAGDVEDRPFFINEQKNDNHQRTLFYFKNEKLFQTAKSFDKNNTLTIQDYGKNGIWHSIRNKLYLPDNGNGRITFNNEFPITNDVVKDSKNQFWIGSENGLGQVYNNAFTTMPVSELTNVWSVIEDKDDNVWFATYGNGMFIKSAGNDKIVSNKIGKALHYFAGSAKDKKGNLYFASSLGLEIIDGKHSEFVWNNKSVFSVYYDEKKDQIIFGTIEGIGILKANKQITYYGPREGMHDNHYIQSIGQDKNGNYWLGSYSGLSKLDHHSKDIKSYTVKNGKLPCQGVYSSFLDEKGHLWLGGDNGLMYYDYALDSIILLKSVLIHSMVKSIIDLDENNLLISTKDGLFVFDKKRFLDSGTLSFDILNVTNGYVGIDPGFIGLYKDSKEYIWITSSTSVDRLDPKKLIHSDQQLKATITHLNNRPLPFAHTDVLNIPYGEANVVLKFEGIGFTRSVITKFRYRLNKGEWSDWDEEHEAILRNLESGTYIFEVMAGPVDGTLDESKVDKVKFTIQLPFYRSKWFAPMAITLSTILLLLATFYFIRQRSAEKKYKNQMDEAKYLRSQLLLAQLNPHFIFNVLSNIQNKILFDKKEEASKGIVNLSKLLRNFLNASYRGNILTSSGSEYDIPLSSEIELLKSYAEFEQTKNDNHFDFFIEYPPHFNPENYSLPPMLLQPFVENAIKHGLLLQKKRGNLWIRFNEEDGNLICTIEDDGVGIEQSLEMQKESFAIHKSLGSKIVKERVQLLNELGYRIEIKTMTRLPQGTIIQLIIKE